MPSRARGAGSAAPSAASTSSGSPASCRSLREFAVLETLDNGKPIKETRDVDLLIAAAHFFYHAGWADKLSASPVVPGHPDPPVRRGGTDHPLELPAPHARLEDRASTATGNTVALLVETTPLTALLFAEVCQQADLLPGVVNIITGDGSAGEAIVDHPDVDKIAFTGSTEVGKAIARRIAGTSKKANARASAAAPPTSSSTTRRSTRRSRASSTASSSTRDRCCAGSRLLVQESVHDAVIARLKRRLQTLRVGDPMDKNSDLRHQQQSPARPDHLARRGRCGRGRGALESWSARFRRGATGSPQRS